MLSNNKSSIELTKHVSKSVALQSEIEFLEKELKELYEEFMHAKALILNW